MAAETGTRRDHVTVLGPADLPAIEEVLGRDPVTDVFVEHRVRASRLDPQWLAGELWGYVRDGQLTAICLSGASIVPAQAGPDAVRAFAHHAAMAGRHCAEIMGPSRAVDPLWQALEPQWGPAREVRREQPFMVADREPSHPADADVRRARLEELDLLYPACVAMFTEEVGVSPVPGSGPDLYRARIEHLVRQGRAFVRFDAGQVLFKAEVGAVTSSACQVQGVWVRPDRRGEGLAAAAMATVTATCLREVAPKVTLYVNADNIPARRVYDEVGFRQTTTFTTVLF